MTPSQPAAVSSPAARADAAGEPTSRASGGMTLAVLTVYPHEVEDGDLLFGLRTPVALPSLTDGARWWFYNADGICFATRPAAWRVQVVREVAAGVEAAPSATPAALIECDVEMTPERAEAYKVAFSLAVSPELAAECDEFRREQQAAFDDCPPHGLARPRHLAAVPAEPGGTT